MTNPPMPDPGTASRPAAEVRAGVWFVGLACVLSWLPLGVVIGTTGSLDGSPISTLLWGLSGLGPLLAAVLASRRRYGSGGPRRLLAQLASWRQGRWYLVLLLPAVPALAALTVVSATSDHGLVAADLDVIALLPGYLLAGVVFGGLEEIGWRGYLLPLLQGPTSALVASIVVGLVWAAWHAPLFAIEGTSQSGSSWAWFTLQAVALAVVLTWVYNGTAGSLLLVVLAHGAVNAWYSGAAQVLEPDQFDAFVAWAAAAMTVLAGLVVWRYGARHLATAPRVRWADNA